MHSWNKGKKKCYVDSDMPDLSHTKKHRQPEAYISSVNSSGVKDSEAGSQSLCPMKAGVGSGGHVSQLQKISTVLEAPQVHKPHTMLTVDTQLNPLALVLQTSKGKKKVSCINYTSLVVLMIFEVVPTQTSH